MFPKVSDLIYVQAASRDEHENKQTYKSRIADIKSDSILMELPLNNDTGEPFELETGDELVVYFMSEQGMKKYFITNVLGFPQDVVRLVRIRKPEPGEIVKIQRREYLRVVARLELTVKLKDQTQLVVETEDVGGGGVSFFCDRNLKPAVGDQMYCWLSLKFRNGSSEVVPFEGEVVRIRPLESGRTIVMLKFIHIADADREKLIRFSFERQFDFKGR